MVMPAPESTCWTVIQGAAAGDAATLQHWQQDADLAAIRDPAALAKLPEAERRKQWESLWAEVAALLKSSR